MKNQFTKEEVDKNLAINRLKSLNQYHFERDYFVKTINEIIPNLLDVMADHGDTIYTDDFHCFRVNDEFYILHLESGTMINWYKHLGRTNTCNKDLKDLEFVEFLKLLKEDIERW